MDGDRRPLHPAELTGWLGAAPGPRSSSTTTENRGPHFDLRLKEEGVLRSWAVPRGLPTSSGQNRLAIAVPDHDLDHLAYTDEDKSIADTGWWHEESRDERRIVFVLHGQAQARRYALIDTGDGWLLHLTQDQPG